MSKKRIRKEYLAIAIILILSFSVSIISISTIRLMRGNARVINFAGIVRGASQKLVKEELMGEPDDALIAYLDSIVHELVTGEGVNRLIVLPDEKYLSDMERVLGGWDDLKKEIITARDSRDKTALYQLSQEYFELVNTAVSSAEVYSENQVNRIMIILISMIVIAAVLLIIGVAYILKGVSIRKHADELGRIAHIDPITQIGNRRSFEENIKKLRESTQQPEVTVILFDINDLKLTNDFIGHETGEKLVISFTNILKDTFHSYGTTFRFAEDEFLAIFQTIDIDKIQSLLRDVDKQVQKYNNEFENNLEKINYTTGFAVGDMSKQDIQEIIREAVISKNRNKCIVKKML